MDPADNRLFVTPTNWDWYARYDVVSDARESRRAPGDRGPYARAFPVPPREYRTPQSIRPSIHLSVRLVSANSARATAYNAFAVAPVPVPIRTLKAQRKIIRRRISDVFFGFFFFSSERTARECGSTVSKLYRVDKYHPPPPTGFPSLSRTKTTKIIGEKKKNNKPSRRTENEFRNTTKKKKKIPFVGYRSEPDFR